MIDISQYVFHWNKEKDISIQEKRGVSFVELIEELKEHGPIDLYVNVKLGYEHQHTIVCIYNDYYWDIQCFIDDEKREIHCITAYPNRMHKKRFTSL